MSAKERSVYFPHLPPYVPPRQGLLSWLPPGLHPYIQLMRLDRPKPAIYFYLPHLVGAVQAGLILKSPPSELVRTNLVLLLGTFFLRGATCTWNDTVDAPFDKKVERTRHRPLARGAISLTAANLFMAGQTLCAAGVLTLLPKACRLYAIPSVLGWIVYPLGKRVTNYPQFVLGLPMAWGVLMGAAAMGADPLRLSAYEDSWGFLARFANPPMLAAESMAIVSVFAANWLWNLCYETMYSYQDIRDDVKVGVKNVALLLGLERGKAFLAVCAAGDILCTYMAGRLMKASLPFMAGSVVCKALVLATQISRVQLENLESISWWFRNGGFLAGGAMVSGFVMEYLRRL